MALEHLVRKQQELRNELNGALAGMSNADDREVSEKLRKIDQSKEARIVILRGEGPGFCAGADLNDGGQMPPSKQLCPA